MKKLALLSFITVLSIFMVGCGEKKENKKQDKTKEYETAMEEYVKDYYIRFSNKQITEPEVSLQSLKVANEAGYTNYDLSKLSNCSDDSKTKIILAEGTNEISGYKHELHCK